MITPLLVPAVSAMRAREACPYPTSAMVSIAAAMICARRAVSIKLRSVFLTSGVFYDRMVKK